MRYVKSLLLLGVVMFVVGCSNNDNNSAESTALDDIDVAADDISEKDAMEELKEETGIDIEAIEEEIGMDKSDDATMPDSIPSDIPLPDDMEIDMTIDNELMSQVWLFT